MFVGRRNLESGVYLTTDEQITTFEPHPMGHQSARIHQNTNFRLTRYSQEQNLEHFAIYYVAF